MTDQVLSRAAADARQAIIEGRFTREFSRKSSAVAQANHVRKMGFAAHAAGRGL
jgi:hypothetical protein